MSSKTLLGCCLPALLMSLSGAFAFPTPVGAGPKDEKLDRQILVFERILDDMLIESPNFLVDSRHLTLGTHVDGQGAVFTFRVDLNDGHRGDSWSWRGKEIFEHIFGDDDYRVSDDDRWQEYREKKQKELYARGKEEIVRTLQDFGSLLSSLGDQEWLEIKVRLRGAEYFHDQDLRRLTVRVKMQDIRAYADGAIDEDRFQSRVEMEES